ncbi:hypothetical protein QSH57_015470 [Fusarium oxysporum f. sp. vasinfectum]|nr:hypothetical protein QSH57_015470 [Fusarium oxysporum f. sp. vasinfectum]
MTITDIPKPDGPDDNIGWRVLYISWALYGIAFIVVCLRVFAQAKVTRRLQWGDALMIFALLSGVLSCVFLTIAYGRGFGRHFFYLTPSERVDATRMEYIHQPFGIASSTFGRVSFMVLLYKLSITAQRRQWFLIFMMIQTTSINIITCVTIFTQCRNVNTIWDPAGVPGKCWSPSAQEYIGYFQGSCNSATDLILTLLPAYMFWGLHMQLSTKVGLVALMGLSIFAFIASVIKTILLQSLGYRSDITRNVAALFIWLHVENTLVITAASIPMTRPLFQNSNETKSSTYEMDGYRNNRVNSNTFRRIMVNAIDTTSEENIMPREEQGITIQTDIVVEYEEEEAGKVPSDQTGPNIWV